QRGVGQVLVLLVQDVQVERERLIRWSLLGRDVRRDLDLAAGVRLAGDVERQLHLRAVAVGGDDDAGGAGRVGGDVDVEADLGRGRPARLDRADHEARRVEAR